MSVKSVLTSSTHNKNSYEDFSNCISLPETLNLRHKVIHLEISFNKIVNRIQSSWIIDLKSRFVNQINLNESDKNILINALPGIEALFLEKLRLSWFNFKSRFQQKITDNRCDYKTFCMMIESIEKELQSFGSMFNHIMESISDNMNDTDKLYGVEYERKSYLQFNNNIQFNEPKALYNRIRLPKR